MFRKYVKNPIKQECPVVLSITETETVTDDRRETVIQRNTEPVAVDGNTTGIYLRAREIYYRARRPRPVRAASIF